MIEVDLFVHFTFPLTDHYKFHTFYPLSKPSQLSINSVIIATINQLNLQHVILNLIDNPEFSRLYPSLALATLD